MLTEPLHPGELLREQFLAEFGLSMNRLARDLRVPVTRIGEIVNERRGITPDTALRLAPYFGTTPEFWMNLQQPKISMSRGWARRRSRGMFGQLRRRNRTAGVRQRSLESVIEHCSPVSCCIRFNSSGPQLL